jgi:hypothetical protein
MNVYFDEEFGRLCRNPGEISIDKQASQKDMSYKPRRLHSEIKWGNFSESDFEKGLNQYVDGKDNLKDDGKFRFHHLQGQLRGGEIGVNAA